MAIEGSASTEIEAAIAEVFAVAADVEGSPRWQPEIKAVECLERVVVRHAASIRRRLKRSTRPPRARL